MAGDGRRDCERERISSPSLPGEKLKCKFGHSINKIIFRILYFILFYIDDIIINIFDQIKYEMKCIV